MAHRPVTAADSAPAWSVAEMKRQGRKRAAPAEPTPNKIPSVVIRPKALEHLAEIGLRWMPQENNLPGRRRAIFEEEIHRSFVTSNLAPASRFVS
jgi:hypothetical protein